LGNCGIGFSITQLPDYQITQFMSSVREILSGVAGVLGAAGCGYYALCLWSARSFRNASGPGLWAGGRRTKATNSQGPAPNAGSAPPVSILKPLKGADPGIYESFRSHCLQDYPEYELIFGVSDAEDPAAAMVRRLQSEFPGHSIRLEICPKEMGANRKVGVLAQLAPLARYEHFLVNDSDILVPPDYLRRVMAHFADEGVGMVTCLYRGIPESTLGSRLEALGISTDFSASVLAARVLQGIRFGLGSTLAFPRRALDAIGGFEPLSDYLADDYELGARIAAAGFKVLLSEVVVDHHLPAYSPPEFIRHQLRWARAVRDSRHWGYAGVGLTFGLVWSALAVAISAGAGWAWALLGVSAGLRAAIALTVGAGIIGDPRAKSDFYLLPLRDAVALLIWIASFTGHTIDWRGDSFILEKGKLRPVLAQRE
jgi:ceramide glucosyltransferase